MSLFDLELTTTRTAPAPVDRVRAVFEDTAAWPSWCSVVSKIEHPPPSWVAGERLVYVLSSLREVTFDVVLEQVDSRQIRWSSHKGPILGIRTWTFEDRDGHCVITDHKRFESHWLPLRILYPRPVIRSMSERWLDDLVAEAKRRSA